MYSTREIDINSLNRLPFEQLLNLYQQGYRLKEINIPENISIKGMATCPSSGTTKTVGQVVTLSATPSGGTSPYTVDIRKDGTVIKQFLGVTSGQTVTHSYTIVSADVGTRIFSSIAHDSCPGVSRNSPEDSCSITVSAECTPNWQCELPLNGYESDGCGNRRAKSSCTPGGCVPSWQCEQPLNGYEKDGCGNRRTNSACNAGGGGGGLFQCTPTCTADQICLAGTCVQKKYLTYGAIGIGALLVISIIK